VAQLNKFASTPLLLGHRADVLPGEGAKIASRDVQLKLVRLACSPNPCHDESREHRLPQLRRLKPVLLGLPCAGCRVYYDAELDACPVCGSKERA